MDPASAFATEGAVLQNAASLVALLGYILEKAREARRFKKDCLELTNSCIDLSLAFLEHQRELKDIRTREDFSRCLQDVYLAVVECRNWNILHVGWEVTIRQKVSALKARLGEIQRNFGTELLVSTLTREWGLGLLMFCFVDEGYEFVVADSSDAAYAANRTRTA
jgi:hypothetical protein